MGTLVTGTRGTGKTRLVSRLIIWQLLLQGIPLVVLDPLGACVDAVLDKITRQPPAVQERLWPRIRLVDTAGTGGRVTPFPLYARSPGESFYDASQPLLETIRRIDPFLVTASIQGFNALARIGTVIGMLLTGLGLQVTEAEALLNQPEAWASRLTTLAAREPELSPAVSFLLGEYLPLNARERHALTSSFLGKIAALTYDPTHRAMFGATASGLDWQDVIEKSRCVFLDLRHEKSEELLRFKLVWLSRSFVSAIKKRGINRDRPVGLILDELSFLLSPQAMSIDLLTGDMEELINRLSRNHNVSVIATCQEIYQLPAQVRTAFLSLGTQIHGATTDREGALILAQRFFPYDPYRVKKREPVYASQFGVSQAIDYRTIEFEKSGQDEINARSFLTLPKFTFLVGVATDEGSVATRLRRMSIGRLDAGQYVNEELIARARELLIRRDSTRIGELLQGIDSRGSALPSRAASQAAVPASSRRVVPRTRRSEPVCDAKRCA